MTPALSRSWFPRAISSPRYVASSSSVASSAKPCGGCRVQFVTAGEACGSRAAVATGDIEVVGVGGVGVDVNDDEGARVAIDAERNPSGAGVGPGEQAARLAAANATPTTAVPRRVRRSPTGVLRMAVSS